MPETTFSWILTVVVLLLIVGFLIAVFRPRSPFSGPDAMNAVATMISAALAAFAINQGESSALDAAENTRIAQTQLAHTLGETNYKGQRNDEWTLRLDPLRSDGFLPVDFRLIPLFQDDEGLLVEGDVVPLSDPRYIRKNEDGTQYLEIENADKIVCDRQIESGFDCRTPLHRITIEFEVEKVPHIYRCIFYEPQSAAH